MKGVFLQNQCEYRLEVSGETLRQGDQVEGKLLIRNRGTLEQQLSELRLFLALADRKKVKEKSDQAFEILAAADLALPKQVTVQQEESCAFSFILEKNCIISDRTQSIYLVLGSEPTPGAIGQLPLNIAVHPHIEGVLELLQASYNFMQKGIKSSKGWTQVKLKPPASQRYSLVNDLNLSFRFEESLLVLRYLFNVRKFDASAAALGVRKEKKELEQKWDPKRYLLTEQHLDDRVVGDFLDQALDSVAVGF